MHEGKVLTENTNKFYILVGASATGKGVLMEKMCEEKFWVKAPKYSTRAYRGDSDDIVDISNSDKRLQKLEEYEQKIKKEIETSTVDTDSLKISLLQTQAEIKAIKLEKIKEFCGAGKGVLYYLNGNFYGIRTADILESLKTNNMVVVCSDWGVIKKLKSDPALAPVVRIVYIASTIDEHELLRRYKSREKVSFEGTSEETLEEIKNLCAILSSAGRLKYLTKIEEVMPLLNEQWNSILPYFETIKTRATNIRLLYNRYIDNISNVDCPILNFYDLDFMYDQQRNYITHGSEKRNIKGAPVFMVCAAPSSGKATLMSIVAGLGSINDNIVITTKYAKRDSRPTDGRDGMRAIGKEGRFDEYIQNNNIWSWSFHNGKTEYAVDTSEIKRNIEQNRAQIFISNIGQIEKARELFPDNIVVLYLHATHETATKTHIILKRKTDLATKIAAEQKISLEQAMQLVDTVPSNYKSLCETVKKDLEEIKEIHYSYKDNNYKIDHVLLNTGTNNDLIEQMINLINFYMQNK